MDARLGLATSLDAAGRRQDALAAYQYVLTDPYSSERQAVQATKRIRALKEE